MKSWLAKWASSEMISEHQVKIGQTIVTMLAKQRGADLGTGRAHAYDCETIPGKSFQSPGGSAEFELAIVTG